MLLTWLLEGLARLTNALVKVSCVWLPHVSLVLAIGHVAIHVFWPTEHVTVAYLRHHAIKIEVGCQTSPGVSLLLHCLVVAIPALHLEAVAHTR